PARRRAARSPGARGRGKRVTGRPAARPRAPSALAADARCRRARCSLDGSRPALGDLLEDLLVHLADRSGSVDRHVAVGVPSREVVVGSRDETLESLSLPLEAVLLAAPRGGGA